MEAGPGDGPGTQMKTIDLTTLVPVGRNPQELYFYYNRRGEVDFINLPTGPAGRAAFGGAQDEVMSIGTISPVTAANTVPARIEVPPWMRSEWADRNPALYRPGKVRG